METKDLVDVVDVTIDIAGEAALALAEAALIVRFPFLGYPFIKQIWEYFAGEYTKEAIQQLQKSGGIVIIRANNKEKADAAKQAADELKRVQDDSSKTAADREKARNDLKDRYADLIRYRVNRPIPGG